MPHPVEAGCLPVEAEVAAQALQSPKAEAAQSLACQLLEGRAVALLMEGVLLPATTFGTGCRSPLTTLYWAAMTGFAYFRFPEECGQTHVHMLWYSHRCKN